MTEAFEGIKVLELTYGIAGPYTAMLLADLGAEVVKVEDVNGDPLRGTPGFFVWNRGKESLRLDYAQAEAGDIVRALVSRSDVVLLDFDSEHTAALGLDYGALANDNPGLIVCTISSWGESGPQVEKQGSPHLVAAYAGITASQASFTGDPVYVTMPYIAYKAAIHGASALTTALIHRERTGRGQRVRLSLLEDGALYGTWGESMTEMIRQLTTPFGHAPTYRIYEARDGWVQIAAGNAAFCGKLFIAMGQELLISDPRFANLPWGVASKEHRAELEGVIARWVGRFSRDEVLEILEQNDIPCGAVRTVEEFARHPQVQHRKKAIEVPAPGIGPMTQMGVLVDMGETPGCVRRPAPGPGEHSDAVLRRFGFTEEQVNDFRRKGVAPGPEDAPARGQGRR